MMPNFLNHRDMYLKMFLTSDIIFNTHNTRSRTIWMEKNCIQSNSFRKEEIRVIAIVAPLTLVSKNDRFVNISLLTDGIRFVHTYINSPETTSWYHHHHKKMTRCQVSTFKSVKKKYDTHYAQLNQSLCWFPRVWSKKRPKGPPKQLTTEKRSFSILVYYPSRWLDQ